MKEHPILFNGSMVRAILEGRKTQTRRVIAKGIVGRMMAGDQKLWPRLFDANGKTIDLSCPFGVVGDQLWIRETWNEVADIQGATCISYRSDGSGRAIYSDHDGNQQRIGEAVKPAKCTIWRPSIHMPRWASRITLKITDVRVQRLQDISRFDCIAEGMIDELGGGQPGDNSPLDQYQKLWDSINAKRGYGWDKNPWVWAITFKRIK